MADQTTVARMWPVADIATQSDADDSVSMPLLHTTVKAGRPEHVAELLRMGADVMQRCPRGRTALHVAVQFCNVDCANLLIESLTSTNARAALVNARDDAGRTPLVRGARVKALSHPMIALLFEQGARVDQPGNDGMTALHWAALHEDLPSVRRLIDQRAPLDVKCVAGRTPYDLAAGVAVRALLMDAADFKSVHDHEMTEHKTQLLFDAIRRGDIESAHKAIKQGAAIDGRNGSYGLQPLHMAAMLGHDDICEALIGFGAPLTARDAKGWCAIHHATANGHPTTAARLRAAGAEDCEIVDGIGMSATKAARTLNDLHTKHSAGFYSNLGGRYFQARVKEGVLQISDFDHWRDARDNETFRNYWGSDCVRYVAAPTAADDHQAEAVTRKRSPGMR